MSDGASSALRAAHLYLPESEPSLTQFPSLVRASACSDADPTSKTSNSVLELEGPPTPPTSLMSAASKLRLLRLPALYTATPRFSCHTFLSYHSTQANMSFETTGTIASFGGKLLQLKHKSSSTNTDMALNLYLPPQALKSGAKVPVLFYLSGLTCTAANCSEKGFFQHGASKHGIAIVYPDTSPSTPPASVLAEYPTNVSFKGV